MPKSQKFRPQAPTDEFGLIRACRRLHAAIDDLDAKTARSIDVSRNDLRCLNLLEHGPLTPKSVARSLGLTSGGVTSLLDRLEDRGFIKRLSHPEDRRALLVELEPKAFMEIGAIYRQFGNSIADLALTYGAKKTRLAASHLNDVSSACETISKKLD